MSAVIVKEGPALIVCPGKSYIAEHAAYDGAAVTFTGRLKLGTNADATRPLVRLTIPVGRIVRIEWEEQA